MSAAADAASQEEGTVGGRHALLPPLLRDVVFRRYWSASTVSMVGDQVTSIAMPLTAVLALHAGSAAMGLLTALEWLPSLLGVHASLAAAGLPAARPASGAGSSIAIK